MRIREREDQRARGHGRDHRRLEHATGGKPEEHVGAGDGFGQRALLRRLREARLVGIHELGAPFVDEAREIGEPDVLFRQPEVHQQVHAGERRRARAAHHQFDLGQLLADDGQAVERGRGHDDGGAVLVVMEHRDLHARAQLALDLETLRRLDVLEIDAAERGFERGDDLDQLVRIALVDLDVEHVDVGELLEQHRLAFHHRFGRERADGAEPEHRGAVGDDADQVAARGVTQRRERIGRDLFAGDRDAGRIRQRQVVLVGELLARNDREFSGGGELVVGQGFFTQVFAALAPAAVVSSVISNSFDHKRRRRTGDGTDAQTGCER